MFGLNKYTAKAALLSDKAVDMQVYVWCGATEKRKKAEKDGGMRGRMREVDGYGLEKEMGVWRDGERQTC